LLLILKKIVYVLVIIGINTYMCSYLAAKLSARMELRRGYMLTIIGGVGFPAIRLFSYLARDSSAGIWSFVTFLFSMIIWTVAPFSTELILVDINSSLMIALLFLIIIISLNSTVSDNTRYGLVWGQATKRIISNLSLIIPFLISTASLILANRTFSLKEIVDIQSELWNAVYQPMGLMITVFSVVLIFKVFGMKREVRQGLSSINYVEGTGFAGVIFRFSRYSVVLFMIYLIAILYLGGYKNFYFIRGDVMLGIKFYIIFLFIVFAEKALGSNLSHLNTIMRVNGKFLIPMSILNFVITIGFFIYRNIYGLI